MADFGGDAETFRAEARAWLAENFPASLKADPQARPAFAEAGCQPFGYTTKDGQRQLTSYWSAPDEAMESPQLMAPWARQALDCALKAAAGKARPARPAARRPTARKPSSTASRKSARG